MEGKKVFWVVILTISVLLLPLTASCTEGPNLALNPDLEECGNDGFPLYWVVTCEGTNEVKADNSAYYSPNTSIKFIRNEERKYSAIYQLISVKAGATYRLSAWVKGTQKVDICWWGFDANNQTVTGSSSVVTSSISEEFNYVSTEKTLPDKVTYVMVRVEIWAPATGVAWVDDIEFKRIDNTPPEPPYDVITERLENGNIQLKWQVKPASDGELPSHFDVYRSVEFDFEPNKDNLIAEGIKGTNWVDKSISILDRGRFYYKLKAYDELGNSSVSDCITALGIANILGKIATSDGKSPKGTLIELKQLKGSKSLLLEDDGIFMFTHLVEGNYELTIYKTGYRRYECVIVINSPDDQELGIYTLIEDGLAPNPPNALIVSCPAPGLVKINWTPPDIAQDGDTAEYYRLYRGDENSSFKDAMVLINKVTDRQYIDKTVRGGKLYKYFVTAFDFADNESDATESSIIQPESPPVPELISPVQRELLIDMVPIFKWSNLPDVYSFTLEISKDNSFSKGQTKVIINIPLNEHTLRDSLSEDVWYWRVKAKFSTGVTSDFSQVDSFIVVNKNKNLGGVGVAKIEPRVFAPRRLNEKCQIEYVLDVESEVTLKVYSTTGKCIVVLKDGELQNNIVSLKWDGKDEKGIFVPNGLYFIELFVKAIDLRPMRIIERVLIMN